MFWVFRFGFGYCCLDACWVLVFLVVFVLMVGCFGRVICTGLRTALNLAGDCLRVLFGG